LPLLSTRSPVSSAYLRDGENIALVPPQDPHALAARILALLSAPAQARRLAEGALALAERFSWPRIARETREVYLRVRGS
jgi:glycosyltransferase involved in cell wall biosynthesis